MAVDNIARGLAASALKKGGVTTEQLEEGLAKKLDKAGGTVTGDLAIQGDLTVAGTTKSEKTKTLMVEDNVIVTNANKVALQALLSGLAINKDANATYGIMYDPADDTVKFGQGVLDKGGKFTFSEGEGKPLAIRAQSTELNEGHLIKWDSATNSFVDSGKTVADFVEIQDVKTMISETITQETGEATDKVMSQKIVTDSLNNKVNYTDISNGLTVVDGKVKANIAKIQDTDANEFAPDENGVVTVPDAGKTTSGLVKVDSNFGLIPITFSSTPKGTIAVAGASDVDIGNRTNVYKPITPYRLNLAVKAALTDEKRIGTETTNPTTFTDTEKDRACEILGATRADKDNLVNGNLLQWDADSNKIIDAGKSTGDLLVLKAPPGVQTDFVQIVKSASGEVRQVSATGVATVGPTNKAAYQPVLRGSQGQLTCHTAPEENQIDYDCVNRGELISKLSNYEKSPNYVLIEKVITGYTVLETAPEDFATNYASYYKTNGKARNDIDFNYVALTAAETFETGKYYSKAEATEFSQVERSSGVDGSAYSFSKMKIFAQNDVNKIRQWSWVHFHINNSNITYCLNYFNTSQTTTMVDVNAYTDGNSAFTTSTLLTSELYGTFNMASNRLIFNDNNVKITKIRTGGLFPDTTLLIYGVKE